MENDQIVATVPLSVDDPARGTYRGQTPPLEAGTYDIRIRASGFDSNALQASAPIWVGTPDMVELDRVSLSAGTLQQIAESGGGKYFHESSGNDILETLKPLSSGSIIESDILIWQSFYWFWAIVALLAAARKDRGYHPRHPRAQREDDGLTRAHGLSRLSARAWRGDAAYS